MSKIDKKGTTGQGQGQAPAPAQTQGKNVINGIDVDAVRELIDNTTKQPDSGIVKFEVTSNWQGGTKINTKVDSWEMGGQKLSRTHSINIDEPTELGGTNTAANPQDTLMAALNACMMVGYVVGCSLEGIKLDKLVIATEGELDLRGFLGIDKNVNAGYTEVKYRVTIKGSGSKEQFQKIHDMVKATSPNYFNVSRPIKLVDNLVVE